MIVALLVAGTAAGCGRVGFDDDRQPIALVAENTIAPWPQAICERRDGRGFAVAFAQMLPGASAPELAVVETDETGRPVGEPSVLGDLPRWLESVAVFATVDGYHVFYRLRSSSELLRLTSTADGITSDSYGSRSDAAVSETETGYVVGFSGRNAGGVDEAQLISLDAAGEETGAPTIVLSPATSSQRAARAAQSGDHLGVLWSDGDPAVTWFAALGPDGAPLGVPVRLADGSRGRIRSDGESGFIASWSSGNVWSVLRTDAAGAPSWTGPVALPPNIRESQDFDFDVTSGAVALAWQNDDRSDFNQMDGAFLSLDPPGGEALMLERRLLSAADGSFCCPTVVAHESTAAVAFQGAWANRRAAFLRLMRP